MDILSNADLKQGQLLNPVLHTVAVDIGSPVNGQYWYNSASDRPKIKLASGVLDLTNPPTVGGATPANLRDRSTHTGTQAPSTITFVGASKILGVSTAGAGAEIGLGTNLSITAGNLTLAAAVTVLGNTTTGGGSTLVLSSGATLTVPTIAQGSNNNDALTIVRATDSSPTGTLLRMRNAASTTDLFSIDTTGTLTVGTVPTARLSGSITWGTLTGTPTSAAGYGIANGAALDTIGANGSAYYLSRTNHTGSQLAATISDFTTAVQALQWRAMTAPTASVSMNNQLLTNLADPVSAQDAVNLRYVQGLLQGVQYKPSADWATTGALPFSPTYANGTAGVGATLTAGSNGVLTVDGGSPALSDTILVKNEATAARNGLYVVTQVGTGSVPYILTRHTSMDTSGEFEGAQVNVEIGGATLANTIWMVQTNTSITVGTTAVNFTQLNAATVLTASAPLYVSANNLTLQYTARLVNNAGSLDLASGIIASPGTYALTTIDTYGRVTAGADLSTGTGILAKTASGTYTARTITGTSNRLSVTNGDGVAAAPTLDIAATYVGQTSITTLGTIATGIWNGTPVGLAYGGLNTDLSTTAGKLTARTNLNAAGKYQATIGDSVATSFTITQATHGLASDASMHVAIYNVSTGAMVITDVSINSANGTVTISFAVAPATNAYRVVIIG